MSDLTQRYPFICIIKTCHTLLFIQNCPVQDSPRVSNPEIHCPPGPSVNHPQDHHDDCVQAVQADDGGIDWKPALTLSLLPNYYLHTPCNAHIVRTLAVVCTLHTTHCVTHITKALGEQLLVSTHSAYPSTSGLHSAHCVTQWHA